MINALYEIFDYYNEKIFDNRLEKTIITIQSKGKLSANGWFTPAKVWKDNSDSNNDKHEINISAEHLKSSKDVIKTLLHEMVHLYCHQNGIKDTSRQGRFHNNNFKRAAEKFGLVCIDDKNIGTITPSLVENDINNYIVDKIAEKEVFSHSRIDFNSSNDPEEEKPKKKTISYICEECGAVKKFSSTDDFSIVAIEVICRKCDKYMVQKI